MVRDVAVSAVELCTWDSTAPSGSRLFVNVTTNGCGSGCTYCYISDPASEQQVASANVLRQNLGSAIGSSSFVPGPLGSIISMCPDSEPFKTEESTDRVLMAATMFLELGNPMQFSTKERVPDEVISQIGRNQQWDGQVVIFTSCATISKASTVEPGATPPLERFVNFEAGRRHGVHSCLYVKPFVAATGRDAELFGGVIDHFEPSSVCVGMHYMTPSPTVVNDRTQADAGATLARAHPVHIGLRSRAISQEFEAFTASISTIRPAMLIFRSAICVTAYLRDLAPNPQLWIEKPELCVACRGCRVEEIA